jgi:uncharacterized protein (TIGR03437 family)
VVYRGNQDHLEYDFELGAGRDPGRIKLDFDGVDEIRIDRNGDLVLQAGAIEIHQPKPVAYQVFAGRRQLVDVVYAIDGSRQVRFRTGAYDHKRALVIDPQIVFDKSFGGSGQSTAAGLARDTQGNLYVAGTTNSTDFSTVNPVQSRLGSAPLLVSADGGNTYSFPSLGSARSVSQVVAAPSAPLVVYAVTPVGISKSADGGTTWTAAADTGLIGAVMALAVDAGSATTLYAATGQGFFLSTDGGANWRALTNGFATGTRILAIATHPGQAGTVLVSTAGSPAVLRSTDFGQTWVQLPILTEANPNSPVNALAIASDGTIFAATFAGLQSSSDGGNSWVAQAGLGVPDNQSLAVAPGNSSIVYIVNPFSLGLQRSTNGGRNFTVVLPTVNTTTSSQSIGPFAIDPQNPATVYAAATIFAAGTNTFTLFQSTDGGQSFSQRSLPYPAVVQSLFVSPADSRVFVASSTSSNPFVTKWSPDGSQVLYSTYLGGRGGQASGIAVDASGSAYLTGFTSSPDFPTTAGAFQTRLSNDSNVFVTKLSPDGSQLVYSTLIGSGSSFGAIAVDGTGNVVIAGLTRGNYPVTAGAFQSAPATNCINSAFNKGSAFVTGISPDGKSLRYSTLLSGSCPLVDIPVVAPAAYATNVGLDANGNAWVTGATLSTDFPVTPDALQSHFGGGPYDGFLARFNPSGGLDYATYLGGAGYDILSAIAFDPSGNIYITGGSTGLSQPASPGAFQPKASATCPVFAPGPSFPIPAGNALVMKLDPAAHSIQRLTYLGAPFCLIPSSIAVDSKGEPWIAGGPQVYTSAVQTASPFQIAIGSGFISKFSADFTQLLFSTYFDPISGLALDSAGSAYVAGTGPSNNTTGMQAVYVAKIDPTPPAISLDAVTSVLPPPLFPSGFQGIAPGEVIRILGKQMGPAAAAPGVIQSGVLANNVAGVQVFFDGVAAPLLSVSAQEIDLVAPFELTNKSSTTIQVQYQGVKSNAVQVAVTPLVIQILEVFNADGSVNSASNPATAGSGMALYLSGVGQSNPPSQDGQVNAAPLAAPSGSIPLLSSGRTLPITFAGAAPGLAAGIFQVNFTAPQQTLMNVNLSFGQNATLFNVWVK